MVSAYSELRPLVESLDGIGPVEGRAEVKVLRKTQLRYLAGVVLWGPLLHERLAGLFEVFGQV